jgi:hypothetical protein
MQLPQAVSTTIRRASPNVNRGISDPVIGHPNISFVDTAEVLACYRSLLHVEQSFRVLKDSLRLRAVRHSISVSGGVRPATGRVTGTISVGSTRSTARAGVVARLRWHGPSLGSTEGPTARGNPLMETGRQATRRMAFRSVVGLGGNALKSPVAFELTG